ncbi:hypothetical protein DFH09DRAFT_1285080 [Mycena vulgaris]|nr:hypothetical protein DFH09DRAFT_1285080 [Mycena vulgaris]
MRRVWVKSKQSRGGDANNLLSPNGRQFGSKFRRARLSVLLKQRLSPPLDRIQTGARRNITNVLAASLFPGAYHVCVWRGPYEFLKNAYTVSSGFDDGGFGPGGEPVLPLPIGGRMPGRQAASEWLRLAYHDMATHDTETELEGLDASIGFETDRAQTIGRAMSDTLASLHVATPSAARIKWISRSILKMPRPRGVVHFDDAFDSFNNHITTQWIDGSSTNTLTVGFNQATNSDARIFAADGNQTIHALAQDPDFFSYHCGSVLEHMLNTVSKSVQLSEVIEPLPVKPFELVLSLATNGSLVMSGYIRAYNVQALLTHSNNGGAGFPFQDVRIPQDDKSCTDLLNGTTTAYAVVHIHSDSGSRPKLISRRTDMDPI